MPGDHSVSGIKISSFDTAQNIKTSDLITGLQDRENKNFTFGTILAWFRQTIEDFYIAVSEKGRANGVASLDNAGKVTDTQIPFSSNNPLMDGTASAGTATTLSRSDHRHPSDTSKISTSEKGAASGVASLGADGKVPSAQLPTIPSASSATPQNLGTAAAGSSTDYSRADHVHNKPSAADIGALPADGTAVNAETLAVSHTITGDVGWYKFFEETVNAGLSRNYIFLITDTYSSKAGIVDVYITRNTGGATTVIARVLDGAFPASSVRWEFSDKLYLYIQKESNPSGRIQFRVLTNAARTGNPVDLSTMWKNEAVSEPTGANNATADILQFTAQVVSAGTNQQILSISNPSITEDHVLARIEFADPKYVTEPYSWISADGSFTLTGTATAATTANILLVRKGN